MTVAGLIPRPAVELDFAPLTDLWATRWAEAHAHCTPPELVRLRTHDDFARRLRGFGDGLRVIGPEGAPRGFAAVVGDHVDQLYVAAELAGRGAALVLLRDAEARIAAAGHERALLDCNPGNGRAAAFYAKSGWTDEGRQSVVLDSATGPFTMECIVFSRNLR